jgi:hypothetical protein
MPIYYDATQFGGEYFELESNQYPGAPEPFCIGEPYPTGGGGITAYISALYTFCNDDLDHLDLVTGEINAEGCATYDEMVECFSFGEADMAFYEEFLTTTFN